MFPLKANDPYIKATGERSTLGSVVGGGGSDTPELPEYGIADAGKVLTVGEDGSLEWDESGAGGGECSLYYDFTKIGSATIHGVAFSDAGATFNDASDYIPITDLIRKNFTMYVDVASMDLPSTSSHQRFIMTRNDSGLIYRSTGYWGVYASTDWVMSDISDPKYFDNSTLRIYIDSNNKWHVFKNGIEIFTNLNITFSSDLLSIGSSSGENIRNGVISGIRVYPGDYTE